MRLLMLLLFGWDREGRREEGGKGVAGQLSLLLSCWPEAVG